MSWWQRKGKGAQDGAPYDGPLLSCRGVDVAYDKVQVLFGVDLDVEEGEIVALLGTNGAGKSTLLKAVSGIVAPAAGTVHFAGRDITKDDAVSSARQGIVQVPGGKAVFPTLTVAEHFSVGAWLFGDEDPADVKRRTEEVLDMFPRLRERWDQMAGNMSGGEQQQLALGMAFVAKPKLLIIDELSLGLAPSIVGQLLDIVRKIHASGCTIILVEQSINVALTIATKAYFMEKGEVRFSGPTAELLERDDILRSVFLHGASKGLSGDTPAVVRERSALPRPQQRPVLEVSGLTKRFGGIRAVNDVTFTVHADEILGLIGPNGAGKTTIFDLISGHLAQDSGAVRLNGIDVSTWGADRRAAIGLGRSFQDARIFPSLTVAENIAMGLERHIEVRDHLSALLASPAMRESEEDVAFTVDDLVELLGLQAFRDKFVSELSTGSRRIVDLAMSIAHDPKVLLLDEPSSGIAQRETEALGPLLEDIRKATGCAMLIIEHDMPLITSLSDQIVALELGAVVLQGTPDEVLADPRVVSAYLGGDLSTIQRSGGGPSEPVDAGACRPQAPPLGPVRRRPRAGRRAHRVGPRRRGRRHRAARRRAPPPGLGGRPGAVVTARRRAAVLACAAGLVGLSVAQAGADAPAKTAWYSAATVGPLVVPAPTLADGELRVSGTGEAPTAYATLSLKAADATGGLLSLTVKPNSGTGAVGLSLVACPTKKTDWKAGGNQAFPGPEYDCAKASTPGVPSSDGLALEFELDETTQSAKGTWDLAIAPAPDVPTPSSVDFAKPGPEAFTPETATSGGGLPTGISEEPTTTDSEPAAPPAEPPPGEQLAAGTDAPAEAPDTAPLEAPGPDLAGAEPLAPDTAGEAPVTAADPAVDAAADQGQGTTALPATQQVAADDGDVTSRARLLAFLALLAVVAGAAYAAGQPSSLPQLLGGRARANPVGPAEVGRPAAPTVLERGIGRFSKVREAAPRRLR